MNGSQSTILKAPNKQFKSPFATGRACRRSFIQSPDRLLPLVANLRLGSITSGQIGDKRPSGSPCHLARNLRPLYLAYLTTVASAAAVASDLLMAVSVYSADLRDRLLTLQT